MRQLLLATTNRAKLAEYRLLLRGLPCELVGLAEAGIRDTVAETSDTLEDNATLKARAYAARSGLLSLADDSGLEVDTLGGEPGPLSRRYAGEGATDPARIAYLLAKLQGVPWEKRTARFRCVIAIASPLGAVPSPRSGQALSLSKGWLELAQGEARGYIAFQAAGDNGFGYDPVFFYPPLGRTFAQLTTEEKNRVSHRGQAAARARAILERLWEHPGLKPGA